MTNIQPYNDQDQPVTRAELAEFMRLTEERDRAQSALDSLAEQAKAMGHAMQLAEAMCSTELVPKQYRGKPADGAAAILYGAELGLNPIQSLQQVMVINGKPGVEARTMVALLRSRGYRFNVDENTDTAVAVTGVAPTGETYTARWTYDMAEKAGYTKNALYRQIPASMLYAKAATEVCRRLGSHILSGIQYSTEELELQPVQVTATRTDARGMDQVRAALAQKQQPAPVVDDPLSAALTEIQDTTDRDLLEGLVEKWAGLVTTDEEAAAVADAGRQRWTELAAEQMDNEHE